MARVPWLLALAGAAVADEMLPPPTLILNSSRSVSVSWQPATKPELHYQLSLTIERQGKHDVHITKQAAAGTHSIFWGVLPEEAQCCFRIAAVDDFTVDGEDVPYSEETCFSTCSCSSQEPPEPSSCSTFTLSGVLLGAGLALLGCAAVLRPEWLQLVKQSLARSMGGGYGHLTTQEEFTGHGPGSGSQGYELETRGGVGAIHAPQHVPSAHHSVPTAHIEVSPRGGSGLAPLPGSRFDGGSYAPGQQPPTGHAAGAASGGVAAAAATDSSGLLAQLEPYPMIDAEAFEQQWSKSERCSRVLSAAFPPTPLLTPDEVELGLTNAGLTCIAAGAVGSIHKSYFAAQVRSRRAAPTRAQARVPLSLSVAPSPLLPFCHSAILPFCHSAILPFCHSPPPPAPALPTPHPSPTFSLSHRRFCLCLVCPSQRRVAHARARRLLGRWLGASDLPLRFAELAAAPH